MESIACKSETIRRPAKADLNSWWFNDALAQQNRAFPRPVLAERNSCDVLIVGGGFTGLWTALTIKRKSPSTSVFLIEAEVCGARASGKNGGIVHGYWGSLASMEAGMGSDAALAIARAGTKAQDGIREFATQPKRDIWWRESGNVRVSTAPAQDAAIAAYVNIARRLGVSDTARAMSPAEVADTCRSKTFRGGVFFTEGANLHPGRLVRELRDEVVRLGVQLFEKTPMKTWFAGRPNKVVVPGAEILCRELVLATNCELSSLPDAKPHLSIFSSYALMTDPAEDALSHLGWLKNQGLSDLRMFLHYFRTTADHRVLMGSGSGPISWGGNTFDSRLRHDEGSVERTIKGLERLLPPFRKVGVASVWGGEIDVSADRLPIVRSIEGTSIHYACGFSGHGVNPTYIAGQILASLALGEKNEWTNLPLRTRKVPTLPPEPFRTIGGRAVRWAIIGCEEADEKDSDPGFLKRSIASLPKRMGMRIGTR